MSYLRVSDVEGLIQGVEFSSDSEPTQAEVEGFITMVEAEVNGNLSTLGVIVPIDEDTSPESFEIIKFISLQAALALTLGAMVSIHTDAETTREEAAWRRYNSWMNALMKNGAMQLTDATRDTTDVPINQTVALGNQWYNKERYFGLTDYTKARDYTDTKERQRSRIVRKTWTTELY